MTRQGNTCINVAYDFEVLFRGILVPIAFGFCRTGGNGIELDLQIFPASHHGAIT